MQIYNTLTRKKEELVPMTAGHMGIYACGPTVYNYIHIGNARGMRDGYTDLLPRPCHYIVYWETGDIFSGSRN